MSHLDARQQSALAQFQQLTNAADQDVSISVLESVDWNVQKAVELIFDSGAPRPPSPPPRPITVQPLEISDSMNSYPPRPQQRPRNQQQHSIFNHVFQAARPIFSVLAFPIHILSHIIRFVFGFLRIPVPQLNFSALSFYRPLPRSRPPSTRGDPDRWVRELEEETGAVCIGRATPSAVGTTTATDAAGPSTLTSRSRGAQETVRYLPDFTLGTYEQFLRTCVKETKIGCVVLVSEEHDDVPEFKRSTLTDPDFVNILQSNEILVWGGDVREREAWSAAEKLQATTYPFVAFLSLQPRRNAGGPPNSRSSDSAPVLTVLSRHQGSPTGPTSASTLSNHLTTQVFPRVTPFLERVKATQRERERDRQLREEQDRAFAEAARKDKERIEEKMAQEARAKEKARLEAEEEKKRLAEIEALKKKAEERIDWRRWIRRKSPLLTEGKPGNGVRVAIRLPNGGRAMKTFDGAQQTLTSLYLYVDAHLVPDRFPASDDPQIPPSDTYEEVNDEASLVKCVERQINGSSSNWWGFQLALAYPRKEIQWEQGVKIGDVQALKGGAQLIVELNSNHTNGNGNAKGKARASMEKGNESDDGYDTEESDDGA